MWRSCVCVCVVYQKKKFILTPCGNDYSFDNLQGPGICQKESSSENSGAAKKADGLRKFNFDMTKNLLL